MPVAGVNDGCVAFIPRLVQDVLVTLETLHDIAPVTIQNLWNCRIYFYLRLINVFVLEAMASKVTQLLQLILTDPRKASENVLQ